MADVVKPVVLLVVLCEEAILDEETGQWVLTNPLHTAWMPEGVTEKFIQEELSVYVQFSGGVGKFYLNLHVNNERGQKEGQNTTPQEWNLSGGNQVYEQVFHLSEIPFAEPGVYEFQVMGNHVELNNSNIDLHNGKAELRVFPGDPK